VAIQVKPDELEPNSSKKYDCIPRETMDQLPFREQTTGQWPVHPTGHGVNITVISLVRSALNNLQHPLETTMSFLDAGKRL